MEPELDGYRLAGQRMVMYTDLNPAGRLFGGRLMAWLDESVGMMAMQLMHTNSIVTKKIGELVFDAPGLLGDFVEIWCRQERRGNTSLTLDCIVLVRRTDGAQPDSPNVEQICHSTVVFVAIGRDGRPARWQESSSR